MGHNLKIVNSSGATIAERVVHARSWWARARGLLGRKAMQSGEALLIEPCSGVHTFGMAFPIDVVFLSSDWTVLHLVHAMRPWRISRYLSKARSVLELPAGTLERTQTAVGDRLHLEGCQD